MLSKWNLVKCKCAVLQTFLMWFWFNAADLKLISLISKLSPILQIVQTIPENYCSSLYLSIGQVWWLNELWFKIYIQKCILSFVLILIMTSQIWYFMGWLKYKDLNILKTEHIFFNEIKTFLTCASDDTFWEVIVF